MKKWIILANKHYSLLTWSNIWQRLLHFKFWDKPVTYKFNFHHSCWYPFEDNDSNDINKLAGFSFGKHHDNSVRVGWTPLFDEEDKIELWFYLYNDGKRVMKSFAKVDPGRDYTIKIFLDKNDDKAFFFLTDDEGHEEKQWIKFKKPYNSIGYYLWPYFGGNNPAPQDMLVSLKKL